MDTQKYPMYHVWEKEAAEPVAEETSVWGPAGAITMNAYLGDVREMLRFGWRHKAPTTDVFGLVEKGEGAYAVGFGRGDGRVKTFHTSALALATMFKNIKHTGDKLSFFELLPSQVKRDILLFAFEERSSDPMERALSGIFGLEDAEDNLRRIEALAAERFLAVEGLPGQMNVVALNDPNVVYGNIVFDQEDGFYAMKPLEHATGRQALVEQAIARHMAGEESVLGSAGQLAAFVVLESPEVQARVRGPLGSRVAIEGPMPAHVITSENIVAGYRFLDKGRNDGDIQLSEIGFLVQPATEKHLVLKTADGAQTYPWPAAGVLAFHERVRTLTADSYSPFGAVAAVADGAEDLAEGRPWGGPSALQRFADAHVFLNNLAATNMVLEVVEGDWQQTAVVRYPKSAPGDLSGRELGTMSFDRAGGACWKDSETGERTTVAHNHDKHVIAQLWAQVENQITRAAEDMRAPATAQPLAAVSVQNQAPDLAQPDAVEKEKALFEKRLSAAMKNASDKVPEEEQVILKALAKSLVADGRLSEDQSPEGKRLLAKAVFWSRKNTSGPGLETKARDTQR